MRHPALFIFTGLGRRDLDSLIDLDGIEIDRFTVGLKGQFNCQCALARGRRAGDCVDWFVISRSQLVLLSKLLGNPILKSPSKLPIHIRTYDQIPAAQYSRQLQYPVEISPIVDTPAL